MSKNEVGRSSSHGSNFVAHRGVLDVAQSGEGSPEIWFMVV